MKKEFINWINNNNFSSIINVVDFDCRGDFLDITTNRIFELYKIDKNKAMIEINGIFRFKLSLHDFTKEERAAFEDAYKKLNPFNWQEDLKTRPDGSYCGETAFNCFKYWLIRAEMSKI